MTHAGLFSGIGGFSLAAQWMGWKNVFDVELDPWCRKVLHKNFPTTQLFDDVCTFNGLPFRGTIDVLSGGFPCQPWSDAGRKLGTEDPRHLWPQYLRIIREIQPRVVVGENVRGLLSWGGGIQFEAVCADLEAEGYDVQPLLLPAVGVGALHKRDRVWFVAHARRLQSERRGGCGNVACAGCSAQGEAQERQRGGDAAGHLRAAAADTRCQPSQRRQDAQLGNEHYRPQTGRRQGADNAVGLRQARLALGCPRPTEPPVCVAANGVSGRLVRPDRGRILKGAGNAIVPYVAVQIFQAIQSSIA